MGLGISRVGVDQAGDIITGGGATSVFVEGALASVHGDAVTPHGGAPHLAATMIATTTSVLIEGLQAVRETDLATCDHQATGSLTVFAG